jgi:hypothetical protein
MTRSVRLSLCAAVALVAGAFVPLSDPIGVYAIIDKVVLAPDTLNPTTIEIHGKFALSQGGAGDHYDKALAGFLYFRTDPTNERATRAEWADLRRAAGTKQIIGFGRKASGTSTRPVIRCPGYQPTRPPDEYRTGIGLARAVGAIFQNTMAAEIEKDLKLNTAPSAACLKQGGG